MRKRVYVLGTSLALLCLTLIAVLLIHTGSSPSAQRSTAPIIHQGNSEGTAIAVATKSGAPLPTGTSNTLAVGHLSIPAIKVNAPIENVGVDSSGNLDVPHLSPWTDVGWWQGGPYPGMHGSAVIDGHLDRPGGPPAVFWKLRYLHPGDLVTVTSAGGQTWHFKVTALAYYTPGDAPTGRIFGDTSGTFLNLITCAGNWIPAQHQTTLRLVVYTTLVS